MPKYRYVGDHAAEFYSGDACIMVGPGEYIELSDEDLKDPTNKEAADNGFLIPAEEKTGGKS